VSALKLLSATYLLGAAMLALALIVVVLALFGISTIGKSVDLGWPIFGGFLLMVGSKIAAAAVIRKAEKTNG